MADKQINQLVAASTMNDDDLLVMQQGGTAKKLSGKTLGDYVYAAAAGKVAEVNQAVADAQAAVSQLEADKDSIAQTVASMAQLGTDTALNTTGMAADAKAAGDAISDLKESIKRIDNPTFSLLSNDDIGKQLGGFTGNVGEALSFTTGSNYYRAHFKPRSGYTYRFSYVTRSGLSINVAYIKTVDSNGIILEDLDIYPAGSPSVPIVSTHTFNDDVYEVWFRGKSYEIFTIEEETGRIDIIEEDVEKEKTYYDCPIPSPNDYSNSTFNDVYDAYDALCSSFPEYITKEANLGNDSAGNPINHYVVKKNKGIVRTLGSSDNLINTYCPLKRILLTAGVHGDEKSGVWGLYNFIRDYIKSQKSAWENNIENNFVFDIIPLINPWGYNNNSRNNYNDVNINRDYQSETPQPETTAVLNLITSFNGDLYAAIDSHSTTSPYNYIATRSYNEIVSPIMKLATDTINECASRWYDLSVLLNYNMSSYPWAVGLLSANDGTLVDYLIDADITNIAITVESLKQTGNKIGIASKINADFIGNLIIGMINNSTLLT